MNGLLIRKMLKVFLKTKEGKEFQVEIDAKMGEGIGKKIQNKLEEEGLHEHMIYYQGCEESIESRSYKNT